MFRYTCNRILATIPVLFLVSVIVFSLLFLAPGDPAAIIAGDQATEEMVAELRARLGFDQPVIVQYQQWILGVLGGDFGTSIFSQRPVVQLMAQRLEATVMLTFTTLAFILSLAIPIGVVAAARANTLVDRAAMAFAVIGFAVPVFVIGYVFIFLFSIYLGWLPVQGYRPLANGVGDTLRHLVLPSTALGLGFIALISRITRASVLEVLNVDFIRTARAKGLSGRAVLFGHALPNAAVPIVTVVGSAIASLISGVVVTETVFNIPGIGRLVVDSILARDYPVIQGVLFIFALVYVGVNLLVDITYVYFDPRIRY